MFNTQNPLETPTPANPQEPTNLFADQLKGIVDESGRQKYDSPEKALEALRHSQTYIPQLKTQLTQQEQELAALRAELAQRKSVEELIASRLAPKEPQPVSTPATAGLDEATVLNLVNQTLTQTEETKRRATNLASVETALLSKFGDKAKEVLESKAKELGVGMAKMKELAEESPQLILSHFGPAKATVTPTTGGHYVPPVPQGESMEQRLAEAERRIRMSGIDHSKQNLVSDLRAELMRKYGLSV